MLLLLLFSVLSCVLSATTIQRDTKYCHASDNSSIITNCTVLYNQTVILICPIDGFWWKDPRKFLTYNSNYTLPQQQYQGLSFVKDKGIYYCQQSKDGSKYAINLSVEGPLEFVTYKNHIFNSDHNQYVIVQLDETHYVTNITVMVVGYGAFNVSWTFDDTTEDACLKERVQCYNTTINETAMIFTYHITSPYYTSLIGKYRATVRNDYGPSYAEIYLVYRCPDPGPIPSPVRPSDEIVNKSINNRGILSLPCIASMNNKNDYGICYGKGNETFESVFNQPGRCVKCIDGQANCTQYLNDVIVKSVERYKMKPVTTIEEYSKQCNHRGLSLDLSGFVNKNESFLNFYCFWRVNDKEKGTFGTYHVTVNNNQSNKLLVGVVPSGSLAVLILIILIVCGIAIRQRRLMHMKSQPDIVNAEKSDDYHCDRCNNYNIYKEDQQTDSILNSSIHYGSYGSLRDVIDYSQLDLLPNDGQPKVLV